MENDGNDADMTSVIAAIRKMGRVDLFLFLKDNIGDEVDHGEIRRSILSDQEFDGYKKFLIAAIEEKYEITAATIPVIDESTITDAREEGEIIDNCNVDVQSSSSSEYFSEVSTVVSTNSTSTSPFLSKEDSLSMNDEKSVVVETPVVARTEVVEEEKEIEVITLSDDDDDDVTSTVVLPTINRPPPVAVPILRQLPPVTLSNFNRPPPAVLANINRLHRVALPNLHQLPPATVSNFSRPSPVVLPTISRPHPVAVPNLPQLPPVTLSNFNRPPPAVLANINQLLPVGLPNLRQLPPVVLSNFNWPRPPHAVPHFNRPSAVIRPNCSVPPPSLFSQIHVRPIATPPQVNNIPSLFSQIHFRPTTTPPQVNNIPPLIHESIQDIINNESNKNVIAPEGPEEEENGSFGSVDGNADSGGSHYSQDSAKFSNYPVPVTSVDLSNEQQLLLFQSCGESETTEEKIMRWIQYNHQHYCPQEEDLSQFPENDEENNNHVDDGDDHNQWDQNSMTNLSNSSNVDDSWSVVSDPDDAFEKCGAALFTAKIRMMGVADGPLDVNNIKDFKLILRVPLGSTYDRETFKVYCNLCNGQEAQGKEGLATHLKSANHRRNMMDLSLKLIGKTYVIVEEPTPTSRGSGAVGGHGSLKNEKGRGKDKSKDDNRGRSDRHRDKKSRDRNDRDRHSSSSRYKNRKSSSSTSTSRTRKEESERSIQNGSSNDKRRSRERSMTTGRRSRDESSGRHHYRKRSYSRRRSTSSRRPRERRSTNRSKKDSKSQSRYSSKRSTTSGKRNKGRRSRSLSSSSGSSRKRNYRQTRTRSSSSSSRAHQDPRKSGRSKERQKEATLPETADGPQSTSHPISSNVTPPTPAVTSEEIVIGWKLVPRSRVKVSMILQEKANLQAQGKWGPELDDRWNVLKNEQADIKRKMTLEIPKMVQDLQQCPIYFNEWQKFWGRRRRELLNQEGITVEFVDSYDYTKEWWTEWVWICHGIIQKEFDKEIHETWVRHGLDLFTLRALNIIDVIHTDSQCQGPEEPSHHV